MASFISKFKKTTSCFNLEPIFQTMEEAILVCDSNHNIQYINLAGEKLLNCNIKQSNPNLKEMEPSVYNVILSGGTNQSYSREIILTTHNDKLNYNIKVNPMYDSKKVNIGYYVTFNNIDNYKAKIETLVAEKKAAEAITAEKGMFLANMSHELRTPLNAIIGMSELLKESELNESQKDIITSINQSANILYDIINTILDFSKLEANEMGLEAAPIDIKKILKEIETIFSHEASNKNISLIFDIDPEIPYVLGDQVRLRQIIVNLISNAVKFTHVGSVILSAKVTERGSKDIKIEFVVKDTGIGFPEEVRDRIFAPFIQEDESITRKYGGTGLGLPICKSLIDLHKGSLLVESAIGKGSTFTFVLPFEVSNQNADGYLPMTKPLTNYSGKILVAEDNKTNQKLLQMQLKKYKYDVNVVDNGQQVVEAYFEDDYDTIIMDCQMPIMDGFCATLIIRQQEEIYGKHVPIIALTASALKEDKEKCFECGMDDYITKPVKIETLNATIQRWLTQKGDTNEY